jgi:hypothetical protein
VDKKKFIYSVNGLRDRGSAGQALYRCCTDVGQKSRQGKIRSFCTSGPVDMQDLFHSRAGFAAVCLQFLHADRERSRFSASHASRTQRLFRMRQGRLVLPADKTDVAQWSAPLWPRRVPCFFFCRQKGVCVMSALPPAAQRAGHVRSRDSFPLLVNLDRKKGW